MIEALIPLIGLCAFTADAYTYYGGGCSYCGYVSGRSYTPIPIGIIEAPTYSASVQAPSITHEYIIQTAPSQSPIYVDLPAIHLYPQKTVQYLPTYEVQYKPVVQQTYTAFREDQALADAIALSRYGRNIVPDSAFRQNGGAYKQGKSETIERPSQAKHAGPPEEGLSQEDKIPSEKSGTDDIFAAFVSSKEKSDEISNPMEKSLVVEPSEGGTKTSSASDNSGKTKNQQNPFDLIEQRGEHRI